MNIFHDTRAAAWRRWYSLSLGFKFNLLFCLAGLAGLSLGAVALDRAVSPPFARIEHEAAKAQVERARAVLAAAVKVAEDSTSDYASWDDSYAYLENHNRNFEDKIVSPLAVANAGVNAVGYARFDGEPRLVRYVDLTTGNEDTVRGASIATFLRSPQIVQRMQSENKISGFIALDGRILAVAIQRILMSDETGTPDGYILMAKELDSEEVSAALQAAAVVRLGAAPSQLSEGDAAWRIAVPIRSLDLRPLGFLNFSMPRAITAQGTAALRGALITSAAILLVLLGAIYLAVRRLVVERVRLIDVQVEQVAGQGKLVAMPHDPNDDELGSLNHNFNCMVSQLKDLQEQIEVQSFQLGRSETNAGLLHNVRNSLNPVSVIVGQVLSSRSEVSVENVERALQELTTGVDDPGRREKLVAFLLASLAEMEKRESSRREALLTAKSSLAETLEILSSGSQVPEIDIPFEPVELLDVVSRNAALCRFTPWGEIAIELPDSKIQVVANRLLLSQVIGNLMTNAVESIVRSASRPGRMELTLAGEADPADGCIELTLADNGSGFAPDIAKQLFERGKTSKHGKSGGLGLHWCANTVRAMGGSLSLASDGAGKGAKAILRLKAA